MTDATDLDLVLAHHAEMADGAPGPLTDPERLGLIVGAAYGNALAERDQARGLADELGRRYATALQYLKDVLDLLPEAPTFAHDEDAAKSARTFLAEALDSTKTPEQE